MRVVKNEKLIDSRRRWAKWLMPIGLVALLAGFVMSLNINEPTAQIGSWVALIIGVVTSSIGVNLADKWMSLPLRPRSDETLEASLKTFDIKNKLYSWTLPAAEHILLSPAGLTVFLVKKQEGVIQCKDGKWRNKLGLRLWLASLSREKLGNPAKDLDGEIERVKTLVATTAPDIQVPVDGLVVLANPQAKLDIQDCGDTVATPADLREKFRNLSNGARRLSDGDLKRLEEALDQVALPNAEPVPVKPSRRPGPASTSTSSKTSSPSTPTRSRSGRSRFTRPTREKPRKLREGRDNSQR